MSLIQSIEKIDQQIVLTVNGWHNPFLDQLFFTLSEKWFMIPFYLWVMWLLKKHFDWKNTLYIFIATILLIVLCDLTATYLFKIQFQRYRPSHHLLLKEKLHFVNNYQGGTYGFISSHAANMTAFVFFIGYFLKQKIKIYFPLALTLLFLICLSRIYLGVHYPTDILVGMLVGIIWTAIAIFLTRKYNLIK